MLTLVDKVFRLHRIRLFESLSTTDLQALAEIGEVATFSEGERILTEGETGDQLYVLLTGKVTVFTERSGARANLATLGEGAVFGEMAILTEETRSASIDAAKDCQCLIIAREPFRTLVVERPEIAFGVFHALSTRLREADHTIGALRQTLAEK
jgi:CRP/FNR family cyclic AMP-dependent transcriptional regulator